MSVVAPAQSPSALAEAEPIAPVSEGDLAAAVRDATGPLRILGGGTRTIGRPVEGRGLSVAGLSGIVRYEPDALTLVARAGTPLAEIDARLTGAGQRLAFEPPDLRDLLGSTGTPTIGGVVAANASGPRRVQAGACRDSLIGVRFVDGAGRIVKNGGRVMKNVTGYDLVKLMAGSRGTLGVLSEVSLKVLPAPEAQATLRLSGLTEAQATEALSAALATPFEVTGAAHLPSEPAQTLLRIEGFEASVASRSDRLAALLGRFGIVEVLRDPAMQDVLWRDVRDARAFAGRAGDIWRLSVRPSRAAGLAEQLGAMLRLYDWGGGLIWVLTPAGTDLRAALGEFAGHATLVRASAETRQRLAVFHPEAPPLATVAQRLRAAFDPRGILNPGLMA